jgi:glycosyltransferase involved in cell wall biosynthesis
MKMPNVLYIVYWGALEPLGRALVLPAVKRLSEVGSKITLVTFEKPTHLEQREEIARTRASLNEHGVRWIKLKYHKWPKWPATIFDMMNGAAWTILERLRHRPDIIHARTFVGGLLGMATANLTGAKFIFHNEGFYPDEQVDSGVWKLNSVPHRLAKYLEHLMYARADGIIVLSNKAKSQIEAMPAVKHKATPVIAVPSCVDLKHFRWDLVKRFNPDGLLRFIYIGSVGGRYRLDLMARFVAKALGHNKRAHLLVLTQTQPELAGSILKSSGLPDRAWSVDAIAHQDMPGQLARADVGLFFLNQGLSEHGCSPTKIGEYWAMGLPVITTPNVGDTDQIIAHRRVGVIVHEHTDAAYRQAGDQLLSLLNDPELPQRCRQSAEAHYSLELACQRQFELYDRVVRARRCRSSICF